MNEHTYTVLQETLTVAVPMWIDLLAETTFEQRQARAHRCSQIVGNHGDAILYLVPTKGPVKVTKTDAAHPGWARESYSNVGTADAFNALAEGIACAAYQPGGIKCFGLHFEAHEAPRPSRAALAEEFWGGHTCPGPCALCVSLRLIESTDPL